MPLGLPDLRDGFTVGSRRVLLGTLKAEKLSDPDTVNTRKALQAAWEADPSQSFDELYAELLRMGQPWVCRYPLIRLGGYPGSVHGALPSAAPYTRVDLSDIGRVIVSSNQSTSMGEPTCFLSSFPTLLCNGGLAHTGLIDVDCEAGYDPGPTPPEGAYYRIPTGRRIGGALRSFLLPHHHGRVVNSLDYLLDHPHATTEDVLGILKGPDLPTGGRISNPEDLARIYQEGEGSLKVCARTELENPKEGGRYLRVRELAYGDTTGQLIADLLHRRGCEVRPVPEDGDPIGYQIDLRIRLEPGEDPQALLDEHGGFEREIRVRMAVMADGREAVFSFLDLMKAYLANLRDSLGESAGSSTRVRSELRKWKELVEVVEVGGQPRTMIPDHD